jgi:hypothetical protein
VTVKPSLVVWFVAAFVFVLFWAAVWVLFVPD